MSKKIEKIRRGDQFLGLSPSLSLFFFWFVSKGIKTSTMASSILEFGGPLGCFLTTIFLTFFLPFWYLFLFSFEGAKDAFLFFVPNINHFVVVVGWILVQALLQAWAPGPFVAGRPLIFDEFANSSSPGKIGQSLWYKCNGMWSLLITLFLFVGALWLHLIDPITAVQEIGPLLTASTIFSFFLSFFLYLKWQHPDRTGIEAFFLGVGRNPRLVFSNSSSSQKDLLFAFDLKFFLEGRPGLFAWILLDILFLLAQFQRNGTVSFAMGLVTFSQFMYLMDYLWFEPAILSIHDIQTERLGFMMIFGDLVWVPFGFTIQCMYLYHSNYNPDIQVVVAAGILQLIAYFVFRTANLQKHRFLENPGKPIPFCSKPITLTSSKSNGQVDSALLASGLWGLSRHPNYFGDFFLGLGWCVTCGFNSIFPFFYVLYFGPTLVHRERRDQANCLRRFGSLWKQYESQVPSRIIPYLY